MLTCAGPKVIEFNVRFGDPEAQVVIPMLGGDLLPLLLAASDGALGDLRIPLRPEKRVGVVLASGGYPASTSSGRVISGLDHASALDDVLVFHAGTAAAANGVTVTAGGRVLTVVGRGRHIRGRDRARIRGCLPDHLRGYAVQKRYREKGAFMAQITVLILMGSDSDAAVMQGAVDVLRELQISCEMTVASAHRSPERVMRLVREAPGRGVKLFVVGAGAAAHLAGVVAAHTIMPVIGVPIDSSALKGLDALLSTVQMPPGVPVATVSIGKPGATNAGVLAAQILAVGDPAVATRLEDYKKRLAEKVEQAAAKLQMG